MTYGGTPPTITPAYSGWKNGDGPATLTTPPTCSTTATSSSPASPPTYPTTCSGATASNYTISYVAGTVTVNKAPLTITASNGSMAYGGTPPTITPAYSGFVNGDSVASLTTPPTCSTAAASSSPVAGSPYSSSCTGAVDPNYAMSYVTGSVTVSPVPLTVTASSPAVAYGSVPTVTPVYAGFVNGDTGSSLTTPPTCTTTATSSSPVSPPTYPSSCSGAVDPNYTISYVPGVVTVTKAPLTITASSSSTTYGGSVPTVTPAYSGWKNGDGPASLTTPPTCSTTATSSSPASPPTYPTTCSGATASNYTISYVAGTVTVNKAPLAITASNGSMAYGGTPPTITPAYSGFVNGDSSSSLTTAPVCSTAAASSSPVAGSPYSSSCTAAVDPDYAISYVPGTVTVTKAPLTITASNGSMTYGGTRPTITPGYSGFVNGDSSSSLTRPPTCSTAATSSSPVASSPYSSSCTGAVDPELHDRVLDGLGDGEPRPVDDHGVEPDHDLRVQPAGDHTDLLGFRQR